MNEATAGGADALVERYRSARQDRSLVLLEGFHALKHALRFSAELTHVATPDRSAALQLASQLAPDVREELDRRLTELPLSWFRQLAPTPPRTGLLAIALRPDWDAARILARDLDAPVLLLENPADDGNVGAVVRVAASAGAAGVLVQGDRDPYGPNALRGSAGLHFAVPVASVEPGFSLDRPLLAADPEGGDLDPARLPARCMLALGTEREGLSPDLLARADQRLRIPMQPRVSSLNLATSAAVFLYAWKLTAPNRPDPDRS